MSEIAVLLLVLAVALTVADWRRALFVAVPVALLQDPLRKLTPGQPVVYVLLVGVVFAAAAMAAATSGVPLMPRHIWGWRRYLAIPFGLFTAVLIFQAIKGWATFGNILIPLIGLSAYLTPFVGISLLYQTIVRSRENFIDKFFRFYVICMSFALATIYLEYSGYHSLILGEVGHGLIIFDRETSSVLKAYSGVFRSSEVAAWHAATSICFFAIWIVNRRITLGKGLGAIIFLLAIVGLGMLTGRRKFLVEIIVFSSVYTMLFLYFGRAGRLALLAGATGLLGYIAFVLWVPDTPLEGRIPDTTFAKAPSRIGSERYQDYVTRTKRVFGDVPSRVTDLGLAPISWAYSQYGLLGAGLGAGSQGTQYFGVAGSVAQGAAEGGLGKIWLELGAPGFIVIIWLLWAFTRHIWGILKLVSRQSTPLSRIACGLASFLLANVAAFAVASQVYSDIFILVLLGAALGVLLAMPLLVQRTLQVRVMSPNPADREVPAHTS